MRVGFLAQPGDHGNGIDEVTGSIPLSSTNSSSNHNLAEIPTTATNLQARQPGQRTPGKRKKKSRRTLV
jgi:hypothetical protein